MNIWQNMNIHHIPDPESGYGSEKGFYGNFNMSRNREFPGLGKYTSRGIRNQDRGSAHHCPEHPSWINFPDPALLVIDRWWGGLPRVAASICVPATPYRPIQFGVPALPLAIKPTIINLAQKNPTYDET